jgi:hypothetical protein
MNPLLFVANHHAYGLTDWLAHVTVSAVVHAVIYSFVFRLMHHLTLGKAAVLVVVLGCLLIWSRARDRRGLVSGGGERFRPREGDNAPGRAISWRLRPYDAASLQAPWRHGRDTAPGRVIGRRRLSDHCPPVCPPAVRAFPLCSRNSRGRKA